MSAGPPARAIEPFFLPAAQGERFCIFYPAVGVPRGAILYLHPFAEEMNKSRRMVALQSRALALRGFAVLQIDLFGCGDSSGDFGEASWEIWLQDVALGMQWLKQRTGSPITLWGLRLGALLAFDAARQYDVRPDRFVLWQPVASGEQFMTQFLRLRVASEMIAAGTAKTGTQQLRAELAAGEMLEIAGYDLAPSLAEAIDRLKLVDLAPQSTAAHWIEVVSVSQSPDLALPPAAQRVVDSMRKNGVQLDTQCVSGEPFWVTPEITECPMLIARTIRVLCGDPQ